jgi:hypothetical protein
MAELVGYQWLDHHLETFVRPRLKRVPGVTKEAMGAYQLSVWKPVRYIKALQAIWKEAKKKSKGKEMLLAGRDVYLFEVLARLEGYHTIFRSDISAPVAKGNAVREDYTKCYLLDTGYAGSVPKALKMEHFDLLSYRGSDKKLHQVFPGSRDTIIYTLAGMLEGAPKYWQQAYIGAIGSDGFSKIQQSPAEESMFTMAAVLTQYVVASVGVTKPSRVYRPWIRSTGRGV